MFYKRRDQLVILEKITEEALESIVAFKPQSSVGDKVTQVIYQAEEDDRWPLHARMLLNIHDALICIAHEDKVKTCLSIMKHYAETPLCVRGEELIIPAECKLTTEATTWRMDEDTLDIEFFADDSGWYRWNNLSKADIQAAA